MHANKIKRHTPLMIKYETTTCRSGYITKFASHRSNVHLPLREGPNLSCDFPTKTKQKT